jgi:hypothetical protein
MNPEEFIIKAGLIINDCKALAVIHVKFPQTGKDSSKRGEIILCLSHGIPLTSA